VSEIVDVLIVGGGGAGLTAALYASRANLSTKVFEKMTPGGQIFLTDMVENYPGFPEGVTGPDISDKMAEQAKKYGTQFVYEEVASVSQDESSDIFTVTTSQGDYQGRSLILTAGAEFRKLGVPGETELTGKGVSYCATCDGAFFKEKDVIVVGGGDSALQEGIFLTRFANKVTIVHRRDKLRASPILQDRARGNEKIDFVWDTVPTSIIGEKKVEALKLKNVKTEEEVTQNIDGVFIFVGHGPSSSFFKGFIDLDEHGYAVAGDDYKSSRKGVFVAGEIRQGAVRQLVSACGEGCGAALAAQHYLENIEYSNESTVSQ
jgi:thioredoxin reductase (NADPH)